jgi:hypothetical protein
MNNPPSEFRISNHPFHLIGFTDQAGETKTPVPSPFALYASTLKPSLLAIVRLTDGRVTYRVRGQSYTSIQAARRIA